MFSGIVGHEGKKFTKETEAKAKTIILGLAKRGTVVSGHCPLGGIDIWAEEISNKLGQSPIIFPPKRQVWTGGYKDRNIQIAEKSDEVHNIVIKKYPEGYNGMRFDYCYHCKNKTETHIKSGGCWTALYARKLGKVAVWHIIED